MRAATRNIRRIRWRQAATGALAVCAIFAAASGRAQDWAKAMFDHTAHDFGTVARGAKVEHSFAWKTSTKRRPTSRPSRPVAAALRRG